MCYDWMKPSGGIIDDNGQEELRFAFIAHLDTTAEPQRAKVGDLVRVLIQIPSVGEYDLQWEKT